RVAHSAAGGVGDIWIRPIYYIRPVNPEGRIKIRNFGDSFNQTCAPAEKAINHLAGWVAAAFGPSNINFVNSAIGSTSLASNPLSAPVSGQLPNYPAAWEIGKDFGEEVVTLICGHNDGDKDQAVVASRLRQWFQ